MISLLEITDLQMLIKKINIIDTFLGNCVAQFSKWSALSLR